MQEFEILIQNSIVWELSHEFQPKKKKMMAGEFTKQCPPPQMNLPRRWEGLNLDGKITINLHEVFGRGLD